MSSVNIPMSSLFILLPSLLFTQTNKTLNSTVLKGGTNERGNDDEAKREELFKSVLIFFLQRVFFF